MQFLNFFRASIDDLFETVDEQLKEGTIHILHEDFVINFVWAATMLCTISMFNS